jgi:hypothetical protein
VVRRIFRITIDGKGPFQITRILTDERVMRPSSYIARSLAVFVPQRGNIVFSDEKFPTRRFDKWDSYFFNSYYNIEQNFQEGRDVK